MKHSRAPLFALALLLFAAACKDGFWTKDRFDPLCPVISGMAPSAAAFGATVMLTGENFEANKPLLYEVLIGSKLVPVDSVEIPDGKTLKFRVPKGAGNGPVTVRIAGSGCEAANKPAFTYLLTAVNVGRFAGMFGQVGSAGCPSCLNSPGGIEVDGAGNVWVADKENNVLRQISPSGVISTVGSTVEPGCNQFAFNAQEARFNWPVDVAVNSAGEVFVSEEINCTIRKRFTSGTVSLYSGKCGQPGDADGNCMNAQFGSPNRIAQDGPVTYVTDNGRIRKVDGTANADCPFVIAFATPGSGFTNALGIEVGHALAGKGPVFITDVVEKKIKSISINGAASDLTNGELLNYPSALAMDKQGNIFIADEGNHQVFVLYANGPLLVLAGTAQSGIMDHVVGLLAQFNGPSGIAIDPKNNSILYVSDSKNHVVRKITLE